VTLTHPQVKNAQARAQNYKLSDSKGLFLLVTTSGGKSWRFKYRFGRKEKLLTLGRYPDVSLAEARDLHDEARKLLRAGKDLIVEAERKRQGSELGTSFFIE